MFFEYMTLFSKKKKLMKVQIDSQTLVFGSTCLKKTAQITFFKHHKEVNFHESFPIK